VQFYEAGKMFEIIILKADVIITSFCTIFATVIGVILGHWLQSMGKLRMYYVEYVLKLTILQSGYHTATKLSDNPNRMNIKLIIDINNTSHKSKLIRNIAIKIIGNKNQCISGQNEFFINGEKNFSQDLLVINPMDAKRIVINAFFDEVILNLINKNSKIIVQYSDGNDRQKEIFICKMIYYNFENSKIFLE
jgi:hypothetical protein